MLNLQEQYERGYLDIPGMGHKSLAELDAMSPEVRKIVADALRALYGRGGEVGDEDYSG